MPISLPKNIFYVVSYPRSGNTWFLNCMNMLVNASRGEAYVPHILCPELHGDPTKGFHFWCETRSDDHQPICVKSHDDIITFKTRHPPAPIIYIARDARDSLLSYYFFSQAYTKGEELETAKIQGTDVVISRGGSEPVFNEDDFEIFIRNEAPAWAAHIASARRGAPDICFITYEQMTANFVPTLQQAVAHTGLPLVHSYEETQKIYQIGFGSVFTGNNRDFFRRGQIGDWKNWYKPRHVHLLDQLIGDRLLEWGFETDPEWAKRTDCLQS